MAQAGMQRICLVDCAGTTIRFDDIAFEVAIADDRITIRDSDNQVILRQKSGEFASESSIEGGTVLAEEKQGEYDFSGYFSVHWDEAALPEMVFKRTPTRIERRYTKGQSIELGLEEVNSYVVCYNDGIEGRFKRRGAGGFDFSFSTGFYGSFWQDPDDSYTLTFKGDRLETSEDAYRSQSKFIVSRSKYSGNLLLFLQEDATVSLQ